LKVAKNICTTAYRSNIFGATTKSVKQLIEQKVVPTIFLTKNSTYYKLIE